MRIDLLFHTPLVKTKHKWAGWYGRQTRMLFALGLDLSGIDSLNFTFPLGYVASAVTGQLACRNEHEENSRCINVRF